MKNNHSSWEESSAWYDSIVGEKGHYYHQALILPKIIELLDLKKSKEARLLDLACGQGILSRYLPEKVAYTGIDASSSLIRQAKKYVKHKSHAFHTADLTKPLALEQKEFSHAAIILALQNIPDPLSVLKNASLHLQKEGKLAIVLNHPCFRIPRQSSWQVDPAKKMQSRRVDRYMTPLSIPIKTHPGKEASEETWSFHNPLSVYSKLLKETGFVIHEIQEWCSDKKSYGKNAAMENRARTEFPLFLAILASKHL